MSVGQCTTRRCSSYTKCHTRGTVLLASAAASLSVSSYLHSQEDVEDVSAKTAGSRQNLAYKRKLTVAVEYIHSSCPFEKAMWNAQI